MKILFSFLFFLSFLVTFSQSPFNYQRDFQTILQRTKNPVDSLSYDKLLQRFNRNDSTLTKFEVLALLIGFTDKPAYKPYKDIETETALFKLNEENKFMEALTLANSFLPAHPLSMQALKEKSYTHTRLNQADSAAYYTSLLSKITAAMLYTGNGKTPETARFALGPKDGEHLLHNASVNIAATSSGYDKNGNLLDVVEAKLDFGATVPYYFIIQHAKGKMYEGFSKEEIKKMQKEKKK